ncbi:MAG: class I SAM-dependent methyltransferase [Proteobacteria bacterium]|nr:class I SAM-dependent methyltransferase [Pseudomonadota bacterium]
MMLPLTLDAIGTKHGTDKASFEHNYLNFYEIFFAPIRDHKLKVLEIGVLHGQSLKMWEEYFPVSEIIGADISPRSKMFEGGRVHIELIDQSNIEELTKIGIKHGPFDIIIEDGSHMWEHQITSLRTLFPFLKDNGIYIVEDLQTNYGVLQDTYRGISTKTCIDFLKSWLDLRVADDQIAAETVEDPFLRTYGRSAQFISFYKRACLIKKSMPPASRENSPLITDDGTSLILPVRLVAHLSHYGDSVGNAGYINFGSDTFTFQGISIDLDDQILEYRTCDRDYKWSEWVAQNTFLGSRGEAKEISGVTVRFVDRFQDTHDMRVVGRFATNTAHHERKNGQDCISSNGQPLCGLHIQISKRG